MLHTFIYTLGNFDVKKSKTKQKFVFYSIGFTLKVFTKNFNDLESVLL